MKTKNRSAGMKPVNRTAAALLALIWIAGGLAGLWISINKNRIILIIISLLALAYGGLWIRVAQTGRKLDWPLLRGKQDEKKI